SSFTMPDYQETVGREILNAWLSWLQDLGTKVAREYNGVVPSPGLRTDNMHRFHSRLQDIAQHVIESYDAAAFSPNQVTRLLIELVRSARAFGHAEDHWRNVARCRRTRDGAISLELLAAKMLALLSAPIMPSFAGSLWRDLGQMNSLFNASWPEGKLESLQEGTWITDLSRNYFDDEERNQLLSCPIGASSQR
ncbi:MAG: class I tRNA ligase family protein, partial [Candidatus Angelobacter sp.]